MPRLAEPGAQVTSRCGALPRAQSFSCLSSIAEGRLGDSTRVLQKSSRPRLRGPIASCNSLTALPPMMAMRTRLMHESGPSGVPVTVIDPEELATDFSRTLSAALPRCVPLPRTLRCTRSGRVQRRHATAHADIPRSSLCPARLRQGRSPPRPAPLIHRRWGVAPCQVDRPSRALCAGYPTAPPLRGGHPQMGRGILGPIQA